MNFDVIHDNLLYFLVGAYPHGPLGGAALTLLLSVLSASLSAILGLVFGVLVFRVLSTAPDHHIRAYFLPQ